ncbi:bifunctional protein-serine/threonine kinase/phosphatase [Reinekea sp.]|uniref:bifunctional protein-serine/threonine kinase/phosphatase n=1 Tax=Reinekea sp. TaxID=1970455 RepID=UPI002A8287A6|nr:bifunctional protein-serine/threonine kinase/phosphatase [Reinekea sp.]
MTLHHLESQPDIDIFQLSAAGVKSQNQDSIGARLPQAALLTAKGCAFVIADGVSAAEAAQEASQACVTGFLTDYFSTPDSWGVKKSALKVLESLNRWLVGQGQAHIHGRGFLTTLSVLIIKSNVAHLFHVGDSRIYRQRDGLLEQLTRDHSQRLSGEHYYLTRAMGADTFLDIDYRAIDVQTNDRFLLTTDGLHEVFSRKDLNHCLNTVAPLEVPQHLLQAALARGSQDNISCQLVIINTLNSVTDQAAYVALKELPFPPDLLPGQVIDDYRVMRLIHHSERSQMYLVEDDSGHQYALKTPSINYVDDPAYIERFILEEWIGARVSSPHVVKTVVPKRRRLLYYLTRYIPGPTLEALLKERGTLAIPDAIEITEQLAKALRALHRKETLHQDLKPSNIIISSTGAVVIDFGSCLVAGLDEIHSPFVQDIALGTAEYSAPEYRFGGERSARSDQFSLALILYEMLTGEPPYGSRYAVAMSLADFQKLHYRPATLANPMVPSWLDGALEKALSLQANKRYEALSEFIYDLRQPNAAFTQQRSLPWIERSPERFWRTSALLLLASNLFLLYWFWG